jgi:hypothetical protein
MVSTSLLVSRATRQVITISESPFVVVNGNLNVHVFPSFDHLAQEPSPLYPHPLLSATCTAPRVIPVVPNGRQESRKRPEDRLKLSYFSISYCGKVPVRLPRTWSRVLNVYAYNQNLAVERSLISKSNDFPKQHLLSRRQAANFLAFVSNLNLPLILHQI